MPLRPCPGGRQCWAGALSTALGTAATVTMTQRSKQCLVVTGIHTWEVPSPLPEPLTSKASTRDSHMAQERPQPLLCPMYLLRVLVKVPVMATHGTMHLEDGTFAI